MFEHRQDHQEKPAQGHQAAGGCRRPPGGLLGLQAFAGNVAVTRLVQRSTEQEGQPGARPNLDVGDNGPGVSLLQRLLGKSATGNFDQATHKAVVSFQENYEPPSLHPATGGVGPKTWRALDERTQTSGAPQGQPGARPNLELGATGEGVALMQRLLGLTPTAVFDKATEDAVIKFQEARLELHPATGGVGPKTWNALDNPTTGEIAVNGKVLGSGQLTLPNAGTALTTVTEVARGTVTIDGVPLAAGAPLMVYSGGTAATASSTAGTAAAATDVASTSGEAIALARQAQTQLLRHGAATVARTAAATGAAAAPTVSVPAVAVGLVARTGVAGIGLLAGVGLALLPYAVAYAAELAERTDDTGGLLLPGGLRNAPAVDPNSPNPASAPGLDGGAPAKAPGVDGGTAQLPGAGGSGAAIAPGQSGGGHLNLSGLHIPLSDRRAERLGKAENADKWTDLPGRDRTSLGKAYNHIVQTLIREIASGGRSAVLHYVNVTQALIDQYRATGGRLLITEGRLSGGSLRFDIAEIDFDARTVELIDLTALSDPGHAGKTGEYMAALQQLTGFPVSAYEGRYVNDDARLADEIVIVPIGSK